MMDFRLIGSTPFGNRTAFLDLAGTLELAHAAMAETISRTTGLAVRRASLGTSPGTAAWLDALTQQSTEARRALGLVLPSNYGDFKLDDPSEFASFVFLLGNDLEEIKGAAGLA